MLEFLLILGAIVVYFTPLLVAAWVRHPRLAYIGGLNAALGVTVIGWAGALMWALRRRKVVAVSYHGDMRVARSFNTGLLAACGLVIGVAAIATIGVNRLQYRDPSSQAAAVSYATEAVAAPQPQWHSTGAGTISVQSSNSLTEPAPFKGGPATLGISHVAATAVSLDIDGELACSYAPAANGLNISFDDGPSESFACAPAPAGARQLLFDGDHSTAYLADPAGFLARLKGVHHLTITATFADQSEPQTMEFDLPQTDSAVAAPVAATPVAAAAVAAPAVALAAVSTVPAVAGGNATAGSEQAVETGHEHARHHRRERRAHHTRA